MTIINSRTTTIARRPAWAEKSSFVDDTAQISGVQHRWTAPTVALVGVGNTEPRPSTVAIVQRDDMSIAVDGTVAMTTGLCEIILSDFDATFYDVEDARKFATAILECCDRIEGA